MTRVPPSQKPVVDRMTELGLLSTCPRKKGSLAGVFRSYEKLDIIEKCDSGPPPYVASATHYDGVADLYRLSASVPAAPVAATGVIASVFFRLPPSFLGTGLTVSSCEAFNHLDAGFTTLANGTVGFDLYDDSGYPGATNKIRAHLSINKAGALGAADVNMDIGLPDTVDDNGFHSLVAEVNATDGSRKCYLDRLATTDTDGYSSSAGAPFTVDFTASPSWTVGASDFQIDPAAPAAGNFFAQCQSELWLDFFTGALPDLSDPAVLAKFVTADNTPTGIRDKFGTQPFFYSRKGRGDDNEGYSGLFTPVGAPTDCDTHP